MLRSNARNRLEDMLHVTRVPWTSMRRAGSPNIEASGRRAESRIALALCAALAVAWAVERLVPDPEITEAFAPGWLALLAAGLAAAGLAPLGGGGSLRVQPALHWIGLLLLVWTANGLPFDLLTLAGLMGRRTPDGTVVMATVYWPGLVTRALAIAAVVVLARLALATPAARSSQRPVPWYGYAAFLLALPYPVFRIHWALGGTAGLRWAGAAGQGWEPVVIAIPWVLAAIVSLLLASPPRWMPRRLLLAAGWSATIIVAMIGPAAAWAFIRTLANGGDTGNGGIELWVFGLFYLSWLAWAIAAAGATLAYQRCAPVSVSTTPS